jgi:hypothetical protein
MVRARWAVPQPPSLGQTWRAVPFPICYPHRVPFSLPLHLHVVIKSLNTPRITPYTPRKLHLTHREFEVPPPPHPTYDLEAVIHASFEEDSAGIGDVTTLATIPADTQAEATFLAKEDGIVAGLGVAAMCFRMQVRAALASFLSELTVRVYRLFALS